jgi:hypothetical protein
MRAPALAILAMIAWSGDGRSLAILSSHVGRAVVIDVASALSQPDARQPYQWSRSVSLVDGRRQQLVRHVRFVGPGEIEYEVCAHQFGRGIDWRVCTAPPETRRLRLPSQPATARGPARVTGARHSGSTPGGIDATAPWRR